MIKFTTQGSNVEIKEGTDAGGYNIIAVLNSNSKNITWGYGSDTSRINFTIDDRTFDSYPATQIYFDGVALSSATGFKAAIEAMFPSLAGGGSSSSYLVYISQLLQSGSSAPSVNELENTIGAGVWVRDSTGIYRSETTTNWDATKVYINSFTDWGDIGTSAIPLLGGSNTIEGYYFIVLNESGENAGKMNIVIQVFNTSGVNTDFSSIIGETTIYLPEIRVYT